ncbi:MAG: copper chaperone PCu(A)C [Xanthobacteraceae bacterium]|nr:copper chaperone PCu(A)C [Xanthobacteraceae bacterium]
MQHISTRRGLLGGALALTIALGGSAWAQDQGATVKAGDLAISQAWTRATPGGAKVGGGYLTIENKGKTADRLIGGATPAAARFEIHEMSLSDGVMKMHPVAGGLTIAPGKTVKLAPGGYHLMLIDLKQPFKQGESVPVTLRFEKAGEVAISLSVQGIGAGAPGAHGGAMMMMKQDAAPAPHGGTK